MPGWKNLDAMLDEQVTREWLLSVGFQPDRAKCPTAGNLHIQPDTIISKDGETSYPSYACIRSVPIPVPQTRGDVLTLCRLLGIEVKQ